MSLQSTSIDAAVSHGVHTGIPGCFKGWCWTASRGGNSGYETVGYQLACSVGQEIPYDLEQVEWTDEIDALLALLNTDDRDAVMNWFDRHYPRMMKLIPKKRRAQLFNGITRAYEDGKVSA